MGLNKQQFYWLDYSNCFIGWIGFIGSIGSVDEPIQTTQLIQPMKLMEQIYKLIILNR